MNLSEAGWMAGIAVLHAWLRWGPESTKHPRAVLTGIRECYRVVRSLARPAYPEKPSGIHANAPGFANHAPSTPGGMVCRGHLAFRGPSPEPRELQDPTLTTTVGTLLQGWDHTSR